MYSSVFKEEVINRKINQIVVKSEIKLSFNIRKKTKQNNKMCGIKTKALSKTSKVIA